MKMVFKDMEKLSAAEQRRRKLFGIPKPCFPSGNKWWFGFFLLVIAPLSMDFIALGLAAASLVFPFGTAVGVMTGQVIAPYYFEGEQLGRREWAGTALIITGGALASVFGDHSNREFTSDEILKLWGEPMFLALFIPLTVIFAVCSLLAFVEYFRSRIPKSVFFACIVYLPSYFGGVQTIAFKSVSEMTANAVVSEDGIGEFNTWKPWLFVCTVIPLAIGQLKVINVGAEYFQATKFFPAYSAGLMMMVVIYGAGFFQEYDKLHPVAFPFGLFVLTVGIFLLAGKDPTDAGAVAAAEQREKEDKEDGAPVVLINGAKEEDLVDV
jgi:hypothetical protein